VAHKGIWRLSGFWEAAASVPFPATRAMVSVNCLSSAASTRVVDQLGDQHVQARKSAMPASAPSAIY
jgi:hypothetical protein